MIIKVLKFVQTNLLEALHFVNHSHMIIFKGHRWLKELLDFQIARNRDFDQIPVALIWISFI
jgi:hypothetical protein